MIKTTKTLYGLVALLGGIHILIGLFMSAPSEVARLWFIGSGLMIMLSSLVGYSALVRMETERVASNSWHVVNVAVTSFVGYATWVLPEAQNFLLCLLMLAVTLMSVALVRSGLGSGKVGRCCASGALA